MIYERTVRDPSQGFTGGEADVKSLNSKVDADKTCLDSICRSL